MSGERSGYAFGLAKGCHHAENEEGFAAGPEGAIETGAKANQREGQDRDVVRGSSIYSISFTIACNLAFARKMHNARGDLKGRTFVRLVIDLVSDLDGTWMPAGGDLRDLRRLEAFLACQSRIVLTFATGRTLPSALEALARLGATEPLHFVTDVGAAIHDKDNLGNWVEDVEYARWVDARWDANAAEALRLQPLPPGIRCQPNVIGKRRLALETREGVDVVRAAEALTRSFERAGFQADVLPSSHRCLDVLPKGVHKGVAVEYLRRREGATKPLLVFGDSENDLGMLRVADIAVLMADSPLQVESLGAAAGRVIRSPAPGPGGILQVLLAQAEAEPSGHPRRSQ